MATKIKRQILLFGSLSVFFIAASIGIMLVGLLIGEWLYQMEICR